MSVSKHFYSLTEAAELASKNRSTMQRQIKAGKLSAERDEHSQWIIDSPEFHRMYPLNADNDADEEGVAQQRKTNASQQRATADSAELIATWLKRSNATINAKSSISMRPSKTCVNVSTKSPPKPDVKRLES